MSLHRLARSRSASPSPEPVRAFYRDFGLAETAPGRFESADGGEQLAIEAAPRRRLLALSIGVDDADDLGRVAAALARLGVAAQRSGRALEAVEPATGVRVRLEIEPRLAQKPASALAAQRPRPHAARERALAGGARLRIRTPAQALARRGRLARRGGLAPLLRRRQSASA